MTASTASTRDTGEFNGKRVLVTGGTKGAGKAIADRFLFAGGNVIITARSAPEEKTGAHFIQADVSTSEGTTKVIRELLDRFNGVRKARRGRRAECGWRSLQWKIPEAFVAKVRQGSNR